MSRLFEEGDLELEVGFGMIERWRLQDFSLCLVQ